MLIHPHYLGIRFLSINWVVLGHMYELGLPAVGDPAYVYKDFLHRTSSSLITNGLPSVDTFFLLRYIIICGLVEGVLHHYSYVDLWRVFYITFTSWVQCNRRSWQYLLPYIDVSGFP